jgi:hypothetical protein
MPLPNLNKRCTALCKARADQCRNPAAYGMPVCRFHGAHRPDTVKRGVSHGRYQTGEFSQAAIAEGRAAAVRLRDLEDMAFNMGLMAGQKRTPGRKPRGSKVVTKSGQSVARVHSGLP